MIKGTDYTGVSVIYFCHDGKGNFVLSKRSVNARDEHGRWDPGGGSMEFGETIDATLRREIMEEYCTNVIAYEFLGFRDVHREHNEKKTHWIGLDFKVLIDPAKVRNGEPHKADEVAWFTFDTIPENTHSQWLDFLNRYKHRLISAS